MSRPNDSQRAFTLMFRGWVAYATAHENANGQGIGQDSFLGSQWEAIGRALLKLLNDPELAAPGNALDRAQHDRFIRAALIAEGFRGN